MKRKLITAAQVEALDYIRNTTAALKEKLQALEGDLDDRFMEHDEPSMSRRDAQAMLKHIDNALVSLDGAHDALIETTYKAVDIWLRTSKK